jgi:hypothetical protein
MIWEDDQWRAGKDLEEDGRRGVFFNTIMAFTWLD